jgi:hypothetical protein
VITSLGLAREWTEGVAVEAVPARGTYRPVLSVPTGQGWRGEFGLSVAPRPWLGGAVQGALAVQVRRLRDIDGIAMPARGTARLGYEAGLGTGEIVASTFAGISSDALPQDLIRAGGPVTAPGYRAHQFVSRALLSQRLEWQLPVPFPAIPIGRWGRSPGKATVAPLAAVVVQEERDVSGRRRFAGYPSVGAGLLVFFDLVRLDVARGLRDGRWTFAVDLSRDLWRIL